jgi:polyprenyl P-hydroxybenzoate/phenylacrylic acid decarboxylase-like protein
MPDRLIVGITDASAPHLGVALLKALQDDPSHETHLVISAGAHQTIPLELGISVDEVAALADIVYPATNMAANISSGSFITRGMVIAPCSARTLAAIATGDSTDLVTRAADVCLKERRPLVLVVRETPLSLIHIRNMKTVTLAGATVLPPVPAFDHQPESIDDLLRQTTGKVLDQFGIEHDLYRR